MSEFSGWMEAWLFRTLLAGGTLLALAWLAMFAVRDAARRQRLAAWTFRGTVLAAVLGLFPAWLLIPRHREEPLAIASRITPAAAVPEPVAEPVWDGTPVEEVVGFEIAVVEPEPIPAAAVDVSDAPLVEPRADAHSNWKTWLLTLYGTVAAFAVLQLLLAFIALRRLRRSAMAAPASLAKLALELGGDAAPQVLVSDRVSTPVCFGWRKPVILVPRRLVDEATPEELRWVLAHELDHLRRGDPSTWLWVGLARVLYFVVPWFWVLRRELRLAQEYLADAAAAAGRPADYAAFLVSLSQSPGRRAPLGAVAVRAGSSDLFRRISMLTNGKTPRGCGRAWSLFTAGGVLSAAVALSGVGFADDPKPKSIEIEVVIDDDAPKPVKVGDKKKDADKKDGDRKTVEKKAETRTFNVLVPNNDEIARLSKDVSAALEKGDVDAAKEAMAKLQKALTAQPKIARFEGRAAAVPSAPPVPAAPAAPPVMRARVVRLEDEQTRKMEEKLESMKKALEKLKDQPEAREALEKTIEEFKKKIEEARKEGELKIAPLPPGQGGLMVVPGQPLDPEVMKAMGKARADVARAQAEMKKQIADLEKQMAELPAGDERLPELRKQAAARMMEFARQQAELKGQLPPLMLDAPGAFWFEAVPFGQGNNVMINRGGRLGIAIEPPTAVVREQLGLHEREGLIVTSVVENSVAAKAGFKVNDIILSFGVGNVTHANTTDELLRQLPKLAEKTSYDFIVLRKGKKDTIKGVTLPAAKKAEVSDSDKPKAGGGNSFNSMQVQVNDGEFTIQAKREGLDITIAGRLEDGKKIVDSIKGSRDGVEFKTNDIEKLGEADRAVVEQLLKSVGGGRNR